MERKLKPLYFFGYFDPIHQEHLDLAEKEFQRTGRPIVFAPLPFTSGRNLTTSDEDRLAMLRIALEGANKAFSIDASLLDRDPEDIYWEPHWGYPANRRPFMSFEDAFRMEEACIDTDPVRLKRIFPQDDQFRAGRSFMSIDGVRDYIEKKRLYYVEALGKALSSEHRLNHSISVARLSYEIAKSNKYPHPEEAYTAGLFHDCGKHCDKAKAREIMEEHFPEQLSYPEWIYHQFVGAWLFATEYKLGAYNEFYAIAQHATGDANMSTLSKIIYAADKIEPLRGYDSSAMIKKCMKDIDSGFLMVLRENRKYLTEKGYKVDNPMTKGCFDFYLRRK